MSTKFGSFGSLSSHADSHLPLVASMARLFEDVDDFERMSHTSPLTRPATAEGFDAGAASSVPACVSASHGMRLDVLLEGPDLSPSRRPTHVADRLGESRHGLTMTEYAQNLTRAAERRAAAQIDMKTREAQKRKRMNRAREIREQKHMACVRLSQTFLATMRPFNGPLVSLQRAIQDMSVKKATKAMLEIISSFASLAPKPSIDDGTEIQSEECAARSALLQWALEVGSAKSVTLLLSACVVSHPEMRDISSPQLLNAAHEVLRALDDLVPFALAAHAHAAASSVPRHEATAALDRVCGLHRAWVAYARELALDRERTSQDMADGIKEYARARRVIARDHATIPSNSPQKAQNRAELVQGVTEVEAGMRRQFMAFNGEQALRAVDAAIESQSASEEGTLSEGLVGRAQSAAVHSTSVRPAVHAAPAASWPAPEAALGASSDAPSVTTPRSVSEGAESASAVQHTRNRMTMLAHRARLAHQAAVKSAKENARKGDQLRNTVMKFYEDLIWQELTAALAQTPPQFDRVQDVVGHIQRLLAECHPRRDQTRVRAELLEGMRADWMCLDFARGDFSKLAHLVQYCAHRMAYLLGGPQAEQYVQQAARLVAHRIGHAPVHEFVPEALRWVVENLKELQQRIEEGRLLVAEHTDLIPNAVAYERAFFDAQLEGGFSDFSATKEWLGQAARVVEPQAEHRAEASPEGETLAPLRARAREYWGQQDLSVLQTAVQATSSVNALQRKVVVGLLAIVSRPEAMHGTLPETLSFDHVALHEVAHGVQRMTVVHALASTVRMRALALGITVAPDRMETLTRDLLAVVDRVESLESLKTGFLECASRVIVTAGHAEDEMRLLSAQVDNCTDIKHKVFGIALSSVLGALATLVTSRDVPTTAAVCRRFSPVVAEGLSELSETLRAISEHNLQVFEPYYSRMLPE